MVGVALEVSLSNRAFRPISIVPKAIATIATWAEYRNEDGDTTSTLEFRPQAGPLVGDAPAPRVRRRDIVTLHPGETTNVPLKSVLLVHPGAEPGEEAVPPGGVVMHVRVALFAWSEEARRVAASLVKDGALQLGTMELAPFSVEVVVPPNAPPCQH